ncbi:MAG TPA: GNAT family N-acetyltransferase [Acidobacteriota bacterium]|nr:GNAT family N-acetyltransferase [Acidobacteriota bacterium]
MDFKIRPVTKDDRPWVLEVVRGWGADFIVTRGRIVYPSEIPGFIAESSDGRKSGLVTYEIFDDQWEIVTLDALTRRSGIGTALTTRVREAAVAAGCKRLWLITTNDNLDAIRFYQRRGFTIAAVHLNALAHSRELKPAIAEIGLYGIPLRDEIEFEMLL